MHTTEVEVAVIGAGVVGLAIGLAASRRGRTVCVLERDDRPGQGASTHNGQVIHAGLYYPPGTLKVRHCVEEADRLYAFCRTHNLPYHRCGKLIVASADSEREALEQLAACGVTNGARGIEVVDRAFVRRREPHAHAAAGIYSPDSGVLNGQPLSRSSGGCAQRKALRCCLARRRLRRRGPSVAHGCRRCHARPDRQIPGGEG